MKRLLVLAVVSSFLPPVPLGAADDPSYRKVPLKTGVLIIPSHAPKDAATVDVLAHFKGGADALAKSFLDAKLGGVLIVVHWDGLSRIYTKPFTDNPKLLDEILAEARAVLRKEGVLAADGAWGRLRMSCFSAGWASIRELLKNEAWFERIDTIVAADSIYAGFVGNDAERRIVNPANMKDFRRFAALAVEGRKTFIVTHSQLHTPTYASTVECADDLIRHVKLTRREADERLGDGVHIVSRAGKGGFRVIGCAGDDGAAHVLHLTNIDKWWRLLVERPDGKGG